VDVKSGLGETSRLAHQGLTYGTVAFSLVSGQDINADFGVAVVRHGGRETGQLDTAYGFPIGGSR
jgi:hypothetical protein